MRYLRPTVCVSVVLMCVISAGVTRTAAGQVVGGDRVARTSADSLTEALVAMLLSGVWDIDGEYQGPRGVFYKLTGYFAYVASTSYSDDRGDAAVISMYMRPMAGGQLEWLGASLKCERQGINSKPRVQCLASHGASQLLDLNFLLSEYSLRGSKLEVEITEPVEKSGPQRFTGRSGSRGKFTLIPNY